MKEPIPLIYVKHTDGTRYTTMRDTFLCREMNDEIPEIRFNIWNTRSRYFHINYIGQYDLLTDTIEAISNIAYTGVFINFGLPTTRLAEDEYVNVTETLVKLKEVIQKSKWGFVIVTGVPDDRVRDIADVCYEIESIIDHTAVDGEIKRGTCYRKLATIK